MSAQPPEIEQGSDLETIFNKLVFEKEQEFQAERDIVESYGSTILTSIDIEPPTRDIIVANFVYNAFAIDETTNDSGIDPLKYGQTNADGEVIINKPDVTSRYIKLDWVPHNLESDFLGLILPEYTLNELNQFHVEDKINDLTNFSNGNFFSLILRDSTADSKLYTIVSSSFELMKQNQELAIARGIKSRNTAENIILENISAIEQARIINEDINSAATRKFFDGNIFSDEFAGEQAGAVAEASQLVESIVNNFGSSLEEDDYKVTSQFGESKKVEHVNILKRIPLKAIINNKYLYSISKGVENDESSIFADEFRNLAFVFEQIELDAITKDSIQKYELGALARSITSVDAIQEGNLCMNPPNYQADDAQAKQNELDSYFSNENYRTAFRTTGYFIEKYFIDDFGNKKIYDPIIIDNRSISTFVDNKIVYGVTYHYTIKTLVEYMIPIMSGETKKIARILLKTDGEDIEVKTIETIPPPPPSDFTVTYCNADKAPCLTWARDINKQQDVVKYLVFKRLSISDPFTFIGLIDFIPVSYPINTPKHVADNNVVTSKESYGSTKFVDHEFDINGSVIYSIVACDAHELYSNYSIQLEVRLDKRTNRLDVKQISNSGAPLPYPNFYISQSIFDKAIFSQNSKKMKLVFNPDLIDVNIEDDLGGSVIKPSVILSNNDSNEIDENDESYKINIINTDLNVSRVIDVKINDNRTILK